MPNDLLVDDNEKNIYPNKTSIDKPEYKGQIYSRF